MKIKGAIFDLDGTLIDSIPDITDSANQLLKNHGFATHNTADYTRWIGNGALKLLERALPGDTDRQTVEQMLEEYLDLYSENCLKGTRVYSGVMELMDYLTGKEIVCSILTNKPHVVTQKVVKYYFQGNNFRYVLGQRSGSPKKPDPAVAMQIASDLNLDPADMAFIGDSDTDMKTGKAAGMMTVGVTWGYDQPASLKMAGADHIVDSVNELIVLITKINTE